MVAGANWPWLILKSQVESDLINTYLGKEQEIPCPNLQAKLRSWKTVKKEWNNHFGIVDKKITYNHNIFICKSSKKNNKYGLKFI